MPRKTLHDQFVDALLARGQALVPDSDTRKYTKITRANHGFFFVGRGGALRCGQTLASSWAVSEWSKKKILSPTAKETAS